MTHLRIPHERVLRWVNFQRKSGSILLDNQQLLHEFYGKHPDTVYYYGGSNGGRECLKTLEAWPEDYDGAICFFPVLHWVLKVLADSRNGRLLRENGEEGFIPPDLFARVWDTVMKHCDELDGVKDGIITAFKEAGEKKEEIRSELSGLLNPKQLAFLDSLDTPMSVPFSLGYGDTIFPGYSPYRGGIPSSGFGDNVQAAAAAMEYASNNVISSMIMKDPSFDASSVNPSDHAEAFTSASSLLDAYGVTLSGFFEKGGKLLLFHGLSDTAVPAEGSIIFYEHLCRIHTREVLDKSMRFYLVPGYGHAVGNPFSMDLDCVSTLDNWVRKGTAPGTLIVKDASDGVKHQTRPLCPYSAKPVT